MLYSTAYLPPISFFKSIINNDDCIYLEANENYQKRSYRNRAFLSGANKIINLSVPLTKGKNSQQPIQSVAIAYDENWMDHHIDSFYTAYGQSAFFEHYIEDIEQILHQKTTTLFDLNLNLIKHFLQLLNISKPLILTDDYQLINGKSLSSNSINIPLRHKIDLSKLNQKYYPQVFEDRYGFIPELSILDLIFCMGPEAEIVLRNE